MKNHQVVLLSWKTVFVQQTDFPNISVSYTVSSKKRLGKRFLLSLQLVFVTYLAEPCS